MGLKSKVPGVSRIDSGERHHGWRVYGWDVGGQKLKYLRFFSDREYGGKRKSLALAEAYAREHRPPTPASSRVKSDGLPMGVSVITHQNGKQIVRARIRVNGEDVSASYSVNEKRSLKQAIAQAIKTRRAYERHAYGGVLPVRKKT